MIICNESHSVYRVRDSGIWRCWEDKAYLTSRLETLVAIPLCCRWRSESRSTHTCHQSDPSGQLSSKWNALHRESNTTIEFWLLFLKDSQGCWHYCSLKRCPIFWTFPNKIMTIRSRKLEKKNNIFYFYYGYFTCSCSAIQTCMQLQWQLGWIHGSRQRLMWLLRIVSKSSAWEVRAWRLPDGMPTVLVGLPSYFQHSSDDRA